MQQTLFYNQSMVHTQKENQRKEKITTVLVTISKVVMENIYRNVSSAIPKDHVLSILL